jgi:hypothetical protein
MTFLDRRNEPVTFDAAHVDLYSFYDVDLVILTLEIYADDIPLPQAQDTLFRFARGYPTYWEPSGRGGHCFEHVEWLSAEGKILAVSDYEYREKCRSFACRYRAPCISTH